MNVDVGVVTKEGSLIQPRDRQPGGRKGEAVAVWNRRRRVERHEASRLRQQTPRGRRSAPPPRFVPQLTVLEDRSLPSVAHGPLP